MHKMSTLAIDAIPDPDRDLTIEEIKAMHLPELKEACKRRDINNPVRSHKKELQDKLFVYFGFPVESHHNSRITKSSSKKEIMEALRRKGFIRISNQKNKEDLYEIYTLSPIDQVPYLTRDRMLARLDELGETGCSRLGLDQIRELLRHTESLAEENSPPHTDKYVTIREELMTKQVPELREMCKEYGIKGYAHARKSALIEMLLPRD